MSEPIALAKLLKSLSARSRVGLDGEGVLDGPGFQQRVGAWLAAIDSTAGSTVALAHSHAIEFAAALYAAWLRRLVVLIPGDALPATMAQLQPLVTTFIGEFGAATDVSTPGDPGPATDLDLPLGAATRLVLLTSGSTGAPLQVDKSLAQLDAEIATLERCFGAELGACRIASTVSHQHIYGLLFRLLWPLASGRPIEARLHPYLETVAQTLALEPLALIASPAHLKRLPADLHWQPQGRRLQALFSSGGPLAFEAAAATAAATGVTPIEVYGSTETGGIAWRRQNRADSAFWPLPGVELRQEDDQALSLRSLHLANRDWLPLSDRGEWSATDGLRLRGRSDRIVKIEEKRISLNAIEAAACGDWLSAARVLPLPGPRLQLGLVGIPTPAAREVLLGSGRRALAMQVRSQLAASCERVALPRRFRFLAEWPHNSQGKTSTQALQALFAETESRPMLPFHEWQRREALTAVAELWIAPDLYHFQGHFPGQPILPGVVQIEWAMALARTVFPLPRRLARMETLKFQALIQPGMRLSLDLHWRPERAQVEFRAHSTLGAHASGRLVFAHD
jgi:3-hydroxymyristoyl/3-hydroxydecanoyl-(acyl carrier protein) dehydratase